MFQRACVRERLPEIELLWQHFAPAQADVPDFRTGGPRLHFFALALHSIASVQGGVPDFRHVFALDLHSVFATVRPFVPNPLPELEPPQRPFATVQACLPNSHIDGPWRRFFALALHSVFATARECVPDRLPEIRLVHVAGSRSVPLAAGGFHAKKRWGEAFASNGYLMALPR